MKLADKLCYPQNSDLDGLTFRERLIIALSSNSTICDGSYGSLTTDYAQQNAFRIITQADAIIKQLEGERQ